MTPDAQVLAAVASPRRREILRLVWEDELMAGAIHKAMPDVTFGAVSLHLRALAEAGLVDVRAEGRQRIYRPGARRWARSARCWNRCGARPCGVSRCWPSSKRRVAARGRGRRRARQKPS